MRKEECFLCGSADNVAVYDEFDEGETWFCHTPGCKNKKAEVQLSTHKYKTYEQAFNAYTKGETKKVSKKSISPEFIAQAHAAYENGKTITATHRGIKPEVWNKYGYRESANFPGRVMVPSTTDKGDIVGYKWRNLVKGEGQNFGWLALRDDLHQVVGMQHASSIYKVYVFEGGEDSLAAYQMLGKYSFVWVPNGAASALKSIDASIEFLSRFDEVIICMDNDAAGNEATKQILDKYPEFKRLNLPNGCKDVNECLIKGKVREFQESAWAASSQQPDYVTSWDDIIHNLKNGALITKGAPTGISVMDTLLGGWRAGEVTVLTAATGKGKSTLSRQLCYAQAVFGNNVVVVSSEETAEAWVQKMARLHTGQRDIDSILQTAEYLRNHVTFINPDKFPATEEGVQKLFKATELIARAKNAVLTVVDNVTHITQAATKEYYKLINQLAPETVSMARRAKTHYLVIGHETKKVGDEPSLSDTNGGAAYNNYSQNVLAYKRTKGENGEETKLHLLKRREEFEDTPSVGSEAAVQNLVYDWVINGFTCETYTSKRDTQNHDKPVIPVRLDDVNVVSIATPEVQQPVEEVKPAQEEIPQPSPVEPEAKPNKYQLAVKNAKPKREPFKPRTSTVHNTEHAEAVRQPARGESLQEHPVEPKSQPAPDTKQNQTVSSNRTHPCPAQPRFSVPEQKKRTFTDRDKGRWKLDREGREQARQVFADIKSSKIPKPWGVSDVSRLDRTFTATGEIIPCFSDWQIDFVGTIADVSNGESGLPTQVHQSS